MATLQVRIENLGTRIATECKAIRTLINSNVSDLSSLTTTQKTNLVAALNEINSAVSTLQSAGYVTINDSSSASTTQTWSITKIQGHVTTAINAVINGAGTALDTLKELADAIGNDANFASTMTTALGNRVRVDTNAQGLSDTQKSNARTNIDAVSASAVGNPDTDFVTVFNTGLV